MTLEIALFLALLGVAVLLFSAEWVSVDITALGLMLTLVLTGLLTPEAAFDGFGSEIVLMLLGLLILTEALVQTGVVDIVGRYLVNTAGTQPGRLQILLLVVPGLLSSFIGNTASAAFFLPIALGLAQRARMSVSRLLMPLAFSTILASSMTLIGTSTNLVVSGLMQQQAMSPLGMFELTPVGLPILMAGVAYMYFIGRHLIPDRTGVQTTPARFEDDIYTSELVVLPESPAAGKCLEETVLMDKLGLGVLRLRRDGQSIKPLAETILQPGDELLVEGKRTDILRIQAQPGLEVKGSIRTLETYARGQEARVAEVVLLPGSPLIGSTIQGLGLRERYKLQILAINQSGKIRYSKIGRVKLHLGDTLLIQIPADNLPLLEQERLFRVLDIIERPQSTENHAALATGIFVGVILLAVLGLLPIAVAMLLGALLVILSGCITSEQAYRNIEWKTLILIGSMLAFGRAMETTGTANYLADLVIQAPMLNSPHGMLGLFFWLAVILTQPLSNQAAAAILVPIAVQTAVVLGYDPRPFAVMVAVAASCSFITPLEPACVIVYGAGKYRFTDFIKVGGLLTIIVFVIAVVLVPVFWPV